MYEQSDLFQMWTITCPALLFFGTAFKKDSHTVTDILGFSAVVWRETATRVWWIIHLCPICWKFWDSFMSNLLNILGLAKRAFIAQMIPPCSYYAQMILKASQQPALKTARKQLGSQPFRHRYLKLQIVLFHFDLVPKGISEHVSPQKNCRP